MPESTCHGTSMHASLVLQCSSPRLHKERSTKQTFSPCVMISITAPTLTPWHFWDSKTLGRGTGLDGTAWHQPARCHLGHECVA